MSEKETAKGFWPVKGNGDLTTQSRQVGAFTQIENDTSLPVTVTEGPQSVAVTVDSNLQSLLLTQVANGVLLITTQGNIQPSVGARVELSLTALAGLTVTGSGPVGATVTPAASLSVNLTGPGALTFTGTAQAVTAQLTGSGPMILSGSAQSLVANLSGSGPLEAKGLPVSGAAQLINSGPGPLTATANGTVSFDLSGNGNINWYGTAQVTSTSVTGKGHVNHKS